MVTEYLDASGLTPYLEQLGFHTVGYGCTTCIGNSGPLEEPISNAINEESLVAAAVLSGNRNFEGRVHPEVKANYLASPMLVVAYALAGSVDMDLQAEPLGEDASGAAVYLQDIWPTQREIRETIAGSLNPEMFKDRYGEVFVGPERWRGLPTPEGDVYQWDPDSTYIREVPFFEDFSLDVEDPTDITGARALLVLGDSITTDHISPAGSIPSQRPAGEYLKSKEVEPRDFNTYGARRGNHEVMIRGTFGNIRLRNRLTPEREGDWTAHMPDGEEMSIYDAAMKYQEEGVPTIVVAGKEYGAGSSRDWAAKGSKPAGRQGGHRGELRADPPQQPGGHGRGAAPVPAGGQHREPWAHGPRELRRHGRRRDGPAGAERAGAGGPRGRQRDELRCHSPHRHGRGGRVLPPGRRAADGPAPPATGGVGGGGGVNSSKGEGPRELLYERVRQIRRN